METLYESKWLRLCRKGHWDFVQRPQANVAVGILAITDDLSIILVEQYRIPVGCSVIELPAGIVGDEEQYLNESLEATARRELLEETGYQANLMSELCSSPTSSGMTSEITKIFHAQGLVQVASCAEEAITVHHVPLHQLRSWFHSKEKEGKLIDFKILASLTAARVAF